MLSSVTYDSFLPQYLSFIMCLDIYKKFGIKILDKSTGLNRGIKRGGRVYVYEGERERERERETHTER